MTSTLQLAWCKYMMFQLLLVVYMMKFTKLTSATLKWVKATHIHVQSKASFPREVKASCRSTFNKGAKNRTKLN